MDFWHLMDNIVSNITVVSNVVRSNIYEGIRTVYVNAVEDLEFTGDGTDTYQDDRLKNKTVVRVNIDGIRVKKSEYTSTSSTGTVQFIYTINPETSIAILYR